VGDTVVELMQVVRVFGARQPIDERKLWDGIEIGDERIFVQDPKYAIRLLVDIAIRAWTPAFLERIFKARGCRMDASRRPFGLACQRPLAKRGLRFRKISYLSHEPVGNRVQHR